MLSDTEVKKLEFELLVVFEQLCEQNDLYYTLCGGTLLGAVRHKGFIPWDDDIDVLMPRADYDRLLNGININTECIPGHVRLVSWKNNQMDYPFMKLLDDRTEVDIKYLSDKHSASKIWIDIFPIDGNPADDVQLERLFRKSLFYRRILCLRTAKAGEGRTLFHKIIKPVLMACVSFFDKRKLCEKIDNLSKQYSFEGSEYIGGVLWGYGPQERIHRQEYMQPVKMEFEGRMFNAPSNYDEYLRGLYGDYMTLPPVEKRLTHEMKAYMKE
jgi:lipopolysaccharide cholinephosphotransferase